MGPETPTRSATQSGHRRCAIRGNADRSMASACRKGARSNRLAAVGEKATRLQCERLARTATSGRSTTACQRGRTFRSRISRRECNRPNDAPQQRLHRLPWLARSIPMRAACRYDTRRTCSTRSPPGGDPAPVRTTVTRSRCSTCSTVQQRRSRARAPARRCSGAGCP